MPNKDIVFREEENERRNIKRDGFKALTDYPFVEFGDALNQKAPMRKCIVESYDGDKYCNIRVSEYKNGKTKTIKVNIKIGYIYLPVTSFVPLTKEQIDTIKVDINNSYPCK